jgi:hypothetical protein
VLLAPLIVWLVAVPLDRGLGATSRGAPEPACAAATEIPQVNQLFQRTMHDMWHRSPTFRRQIARLAADSSLVVTINPWPGIVASRNRARTSFVRKNLTLVRADVQVRLLDTSTFVETIAHELEHVLEQLDEVDLTRSVDRQGVRATGSLSRSAEFETERARKVGEIVALEYRASTSSPESCPGRPQ